MTLRRSIAWQLATLVATLVASLVTAPRLPDRVPTHWDIHGHPDAWGSPAFALWFGPGVVGLMLVLTVAIPWLPGGNNVARFSKTYGKLMAIISGFMAFMHVATLYATVGAGDLPSVFLIGLFLFFAAMGNLMGRVKKNPYVGVRTPWTLKSERVWELTHRHTAWIFVAGGLIGAFLVAIGLPFPVAFVWMMLIAFAPIFDSYFLYRKLEGR